MRRFSATAAVLLTFLVVYSAAAQQQLSVQGAKTMIGGLNPQPIKMQMVDTSKALTPMNIGNTFRPARPPATFTLSRFFPKITAGPWPPKIPSLSLFKAPKTPTPINPQSAFHFPQ